MRASIVQPCSFGLWSVLRRSPDETNRLHHNIKASEHPVIGKPESKLSPRANTAGERAGSRGDEARWAGRAACRGAGRRGLLLGMLAAGDDGASEPPIASPPVPLAVSRCLLAPNRTRASRSSFASFRLGPGSAPSDGRTARPCSPAAGEFAVPPRCAACRPADQRCRQSLKMRSRFVRCPFPALGVCCLRCRRRASPSSGPFCRKRAPNLTLFLNFWVVFEGPFHVEYF